MRYFKVQEKENEISVWVVREDGKEKCLHTDLDSTEASWYNDLMDWYDAEDDERRGCSVLNGFGGMQNVITEITRNDAFLLMV